MKYRIAIGIIFLFVYANTSVLISGCAQIGSPTGGAKDTIKPTLIRTTPASGSVNFRDKRIVLQFDEYITVDDIISNVLISPYQQAPPNISFDFRTVTVRFRDTLLPNTTYSINFGNAIRDLNEGNTLSNFVYTFSTGSNIDSLSLSGKVTMAETGKVDSTLIVMLYRNLEDSAVKTLKPAYISRVRGDGSFTFNYLPAGTFKVFALRDGDNSRTYNSATEAFAFNDTSYILDENVSGIDLYAYEEKKPLQSIATARVSKPSADKRLKYTTSITGGFQDLLAPLTVNFVAGIKEFPEGSILLTDTNYVSLTGTKYSFDSLRTIYTIAQQWKPGEAYRLIIKEGITDSLGNSLSRTDTISFAANKTQAYGRVVLRFTNLDLSKNPVLQFLQADKLMMSFPLGTSQFKNDLIPPGEYDMRILFDVNRNGTWDPGNFDEKKQPEKAMTIGQKLSIRADWDNERDIIL